jgi:hypothetical protein
MRSRLPSPFSPTLPAQAAIDPHASSSSSDFQSTAAESAEVIIRELERRTERHGPMRPDLAVRLVRSAASALNRAEHGSRHSDSGTTIAWLGAALFFALTGKAPLGPLPGVMTPAVPPPASSLSPYHVPETLDYVISKCLARRRTDRFSSVSELRVALSAVLVTDTSLAADRSGAMHSVPSSSGLMQRVAEANAANDWGSGEHPKTPAALDMDSKRRPARAPAHLYYTRAA